MKRPLQQISRRMGEISCIMDFEANINNNVQLSHNAELKFPYRNDKTKFRTIFFKDFRLSCIKSGDNWFLDKYNHIIQFAYASKINEKIILVGYEEPNKTNAFILPFKSSRLDIYEAIYEPEQRIKITSKVEDIKCKMVCLSYGSGKVFQPLLHTLCEN